MKKNNFLKVIASSLIKNKTTIKKYSGNFSLKDNRFDPIIVNSLYALEKSMLHLNVSITKDTMILGITNSGCKKFIEKVTEGISKVQPRPAFFVRSGAQTLATYPATALQTHGCAITLSCNNLKFKYLCHILEEYLYRYNNQHGIIIYSDYLEDDIISVALIISKSDTDDTSLVKNYYKNTREAIIDIAEINLLKE